MMVRVAYVDPEHQFWQQLEVPDACTLQQAIELSGVLEQMPFLDLETHKVGVYGRFAKLDAALKPGDRVEIYRPITADPLTVPRRDKDDKE
jgi:putative ubiquitin-RnfH superfamily antitoxin RatB of RatAB toxin-antitoxin module